MSFYEPEDEKLKESAADTNHGIKSPPLTIASLCLLDSSLRSIASSADFPINSQSLHYVQQELSDMKYAIHAILVLCRPTATLKFANHWSVKIFFGHGTLSMDFAEKSGCGVFGFQVNGVSEAIMADLLSYQTRKDGQVVKETYNVIARVMPPAFEGSMEEFLKRQPEKQTHIEQNLGTYLWKWTKKYDKYELPKLKKVHMIAKMIEEYASNTQKYCSLVNNCQRFAFEVFKYVAFECYPERVLELGNKFQSTTDKLDVAQRYANASIQESPHRKLQPKKKVTHKSSV